VGERENVAECVERINTMNGVDGLYLSSRPSK